MKKITCILLLAFLLLGGAWAKAQQSALIEDLIVETYYISDANDSIAGETDGTPIATGSTTYRIFIDMIPGAKITKIFGNQYHALKIASDSTFFNTGSTIFGNGVNKPTVSSNNNDPLRPLDTWLSLGYATKTNLGILKLADTDNSLITSLKNKDSNVGIPLDVADGIVNSNVSTVTWSNYGFVDTSIFGSIKLDSLFLSYDAYVEDTKLGGGVKGTTPDNKVLVAQLTTKGKLSFELNVVITDSITQKSITYIAKNGADSISNNSTPAPTYSAYLSYPKQCGCIDPNYAEYKTSFTCSRAGACINPIVLGCMDTLACNYDPKANKNIHSLCCYPGFCKDRDLSLVCPGISATVGFNLFPNPAQEEVTVQILAAGKQEIKYAIFDCFGLLIVEKNMGVLFGTVNETINLSNYNSGLYMVRVSSGTTIENKLFMKN